MAYILRRRKLGRTSCNEIAAKSKTGIIVVRNDNEIPEGHDMVFRWGTTSNLPYRVQECVNIPAAIHWVADKATSRKIMADAGLSPRTWLTWKDWFDGNVSYEEDNIWSEGSFIVRPNTHSQGRDVDFCQNIWDVMNATHKYGSGNYYISEYIDKVAEYRVFVVSGRVACVAKKTPADEKAIAWNVAQGGRFDNVRWNDWPMEAIRTSIEAFKLSGLDFGGVDVMVDAQGRAYVLEINSAPSLTSPYRQECMTKCFDWIVTHGKDIIHVADYNSYLGVIHPAIEGKARNADQERESSNQ